MTTSTTFNQAELDTLIEAATFKYKNTQDGYDQFADTDPVTLRPIGRHVKGGYVQEFLVHATQIIPTYGAKLAEGYTLHELDVINHGTGYYIYFYKPAAQQAEELNAALTGIKAKYEDAISANLEKLIQLEIEQEELAITEEAQRAAVKAIQAAKDSRAAEIRARYESAQVRGSKPKAK
jgi:hypothetical protein